MTFRERLSHAWNAFKNIRDPTGGPMPRGYEYGTYYRPDVHRLRPKNDKSIMSMVLNRIAVDASSVDIKHVRVNENGQYAEDINSHLNECLTVEANIDQSAREFIRDAIMSMFDEGVVALVPVDTDLNPNTHAFDVLSIRTGKILQWYPSQIEVSVYNEKTCQRETILIDKKSCAIVENPFYSIMNEPNGTLQRLIRKLALLDSVDEIAGNGKLDLIIQLPYAIRSRLKENEAKERIHQVESQLKDGKYGIAYIDGTEKVVQLNRPLDNNLLKQVEYLTSMFFNQLGLTQSVFDGTADEKAMLNYRNRVIEPVLNAIVEEMRRKFLTKTARTQRQTIMYLNAPFKLVPVEQLAEIADKFTRNEIMTSNEIRALVGLKPSDDPGADELRNKNLNREAGDIPPGQEVPMTNKEEQMSVMDIPLSQLR